MADLATLRIGVDSRPVDAAANDLDELAASAGRAERATQSLGATTKTTNAAMTGMNNAVRQAQAAQEAAAQAMGGVAGRTKLASHEVTNLAFQFQDLGVQLAGGANPLTAIVQQGSQISGIRMQSGMSVGVFTKAIGSMIATAAGAVLLNPVFLGIAAAVGTVSAAVNFMADDISKASGVTVTASDVMLGAFDVLRGFVSRQVTAVFAYFGTTAGEVWDKVVQYTRKAVNIMIGLVSYVPRALIEGFKVIPEAIGRLMSGDFMGALDLVMKSGAKLVTGTFQTDYVGKIGSVLQGAAVNRSNQRAAEEAGKKIGKTVARGAASGFKDEFANLYKDALESVSSQMAGVNPLMSKDAIDDILDAQATAQNEARAKDAAALQDNIDFATRAAGDIGTLIGGTFGQGVKDLADVLSRDFPKLFGDLGGMFKDVVSKIDEQLGELGTSLKQVGAFAGIGGIAASATGGSGLGGSVGGALGGEIGKKVLGKALGSFAGPLGAIAGGLLGGLIGGLLAGTKKGVVTLSQIGGGAMQKTLTGNNAQLKSVADKMATGLLKGIGDIAEQLGGALGGTVKLSLGQRNKDFVVDPTGAGRTKGAGVINFGQDQAAAVAYVTQLAIQQGIITGISAGAQTLIKASGDLNDQVQKALKFDQVFKDLKKESDPLGASLDDLSIEMGKLKAIFAEAGASAEDYAKLEELFALKQAKAIFEANKPRRELEIQLMEAQGDAAGALAARRALELESMDASLRGLQQQVYAAQDAAKANEELAAAQAEVAESAKAAEEAAKALAGQRRELEIDLMEALGNATGALAARRQLELEAMDESLRGLQKQIWAAREKSEAEASAVKAAQEAADAQAKAAQEAADAAQRYRDALLDVTKTIQEEINRLRGIGSGANAPMLRAQFAALTAQARTGDLDALGKLPELSRSIEEAAIATATSALDIARIRGWLASSLSETISGQSASSISTLTAQPSNVFDSNQVPSFSANDNLRSEVGAMRDEMKIALFQIAKNTGKASDQLQRWDGEGLPEARGY